MLRQNVLDFTFVFRYKQVVFQEKDIDLRQRQRQAEVTGWLIGSGGCH